MTVKGGGSYGISSKGGGNCPSVDLDAAGTRAQADQRSTAPDLALESPAPHFVHGDRMVAADGAGAGARIELERRVVRQVDLDAA